MYDVTTIGDCMEDIFVFPALDEMEKVGQDLVLGYGEKITINDIYRDIGGSACNVAVGLSKLGLKTAILSTVGKDSDGQEIKLRLKKAGVSISFLVTSPEKKTSFSIIISYKVERSILVFHSFTPEDFKIPKNLNTQWVYVGPLGEGYPGLYAQITALAAEKDIKIALNPGAVQIHDGFSALSGVLRVTKILFLNKEEGMKLAGISGLATVRDIVRILLKTGPEIVVVTDGKNGAWAASQEEVMKVGSYPAERLEATGAGDAFASGFLSGIIKSEKIFDSLKWGVTNSASVIEKYGAQKGLLSLSQIKRRVKEYRWPPSTLRFS